MGTNVAPILANIFVAMLENELLKTCKLDPKLQLPVLPNIFMDDTVGICYGTIEDIVYWTKQFNLLRESIKIKKWTIGNTVECMDLGDFQGFKIFQL